MKVGRIKENETIPLSAPTGMHTVWLKIDWLRSKPLQLNIAADMTVGLVIDKNPRASLRYWVSLIAAGLLGAIGFELGGPFLILWVIALVILVSIFCRPSLREL
jgi:hypothetical protein